MKQLFQRLSFDFGAILNPLVALVLLALVILLAGLWINTLLITSDVSSGVRDALADNENVVFINVNGQTVSVGGVVESSSARKELLTTLQGVSGVSTIIDNTSIGSRVALMDNAPAADVKTSEEPAAESKSEKSIKPAAKDVAAKEVAAIQMPEPALPEPASSTPKEPDTKTPASLVTAAVQNQTAEIIKPATVSTQETANAKKPKVAGFDTSLPEVDMAVLKQNDNRALPTTATDTVTTSTASGSSVAVSATGTSSQQPAAPLNLEKILPALNALSIKFPQNSDVLTDDARAYLQRAALPLKRLGRVRLEVGGHTDSWGSEVLNQEMSQRRAQSVVNYLTLLGVDGSKLSAKGYGETRPKTSNDTLAGRVANRRIEFKVIE